LNRERAPAGVNVTRPSPARIYDYLLGGKDNFAADRAAAERLLVHAPDAGSACRANRAFLRRAVRYLSGQGVRQFIDIGTGLPTQGNVPEVARAADPDARVVCVDNDPIVITHAQALLPAGDRTAVVGADMREPQVILRHREVRRLIDFSQPVGVLFAAVLHFATDADDPDEIVRAFGERMAPGSYLVLSHDTTEGHALELITLGKEVYSGATAPMVMRSREAILGLFEGFELAEPGLVRLGEWRPDTLRERQERGGHWLLCGVGRRP
jgi:hypothetical protein